MDISMVVILFNLFGMMAFLIVAIFQNLYGIMVSGIKTNYTNLIGRQTVNGMAVIGMVVM